MKVLLVLIAIILLVGVVNADTLISIASNDGDLYELTDATFLTIISDTGDYVRNNIADYDWPGYSLATTTTSIFDIHRRTGLTLPTASLDDTAIISSAYLSVLGQQKVNGLGSLNFELIDFTPINSGIYVVSDYSHTTFTPMAGNITYANFIDSGGWNNFTLNSAGLAKINKTGNTTFMLDNSASVYKQNLTWVSGGLSAFRISSALGGGTSWAPRLTITYTLPDITPPNSITGLSNTTTCNSINWSFTKPSDADYNGLMVWKNGTFFHNLSSSATSDLWLNLTELTEYTFSSKTFDATNNINATFINRTSTTSKCPPGPIASFISNVTCGIVPFRVQFNDTTYSSTNLTGWNWSFGDGNYSAVQNPVFEYNLSGMFTVNINATNAWGSNISQISNYMRGVPDWATCPATPTPTPTWQPEINPSTEVDIQPNGWMLIAGGMILFIWFIFRRTR